MFGYLLGHDNGDRIICKNCFSNDRFTVVSEDSFVPPHMENIAHHQLEVNSIHRDTMVVWGGSIVCIRCRNNIGSLLDNQNFLLKDEVLYYHLNRGVVHQINDQTTFSDSVPNQQSSITQFRYEGPDGYICKSCCDSHLPDHLVASDLPEPFITELGLIVRPPNPYHFNMRYAPILDFVEPVELEEDYPTNEMICSTCAFVLGKNIQEVAPEGLGVEVYRFDFQGVLYRKFESRLQLPGMTMYALP